MEAYKTQLDSKLDLTLYLEGLFTHDEDEHETKIGTNLDANELVNIIEVEFDDVENAAGVSITEPESIPDWGRSPFKALLVKTAGMDFILPAMYVAYIEPVKKNILRIPLGDDSFQGVVTLRDKSIAVIDLFTLVVEDAQEQKKQTSQITSHYVEHVIVMEGASYALACDQVTEMITLQPEDVRWNSVDYVSPLYAGVVKEYLCPLINIDTLVQQVSAMPFVQTLDENNY